MLALLACFHAIQYCVLLKDHPVKPLVFIKHRWLCDSSSSQVTLILNCIFHKDHLQYDGEWGRGRKTIMPSGETVQHLTGDPISSENAEPDLRLMGSHLHLQVPAKIRSTATWQNPEAFLWFSFAGHNGLVCMRSCYMQRSPTTHTLLWIMIMMWHW